MTNTTTSALDISKPEGCLTVRELIERLRAFDPDMPVVLDTNRGTAYDYVTGTEEVAVTRNHWLDEYPNDSPLEAAEPEAYKEAHLTGRAVPSAIRIY